MSAIAVSYESLLKVRKGAVDIVDVPEFGFVAVTGTGEPGGAWRWTCTFPRDHLTRCARFPGKAPSRRTQFR